MFSSVDSGRRAARAIIGATDANIISALPAFLLGGFAVAIREDIDLDLSQLGLVLSAYYVVGTLLSVPGGQLADKRGGWSATRLGISLSTAALLGIALVARTWWHLLIAISVAGMGNAITQPATNLALSQTVSPSRHGLALGVKQAAVPSVSMAAGMAVGLVVSGPLNWRTFMILASGACLVIYFLSEPPTSWVYARDPGLVVGNGRAAPRHVMLLLTVGGGLGTIASSTLGPFFLVSKVEQGVSPVTAGALMAVGSGLGISVRVMAGWLVDRMSGHSLRTVSLLLVAGSFGFLLVAHTIEPVILAFGALLAFGAGWGWTGLFHYAIVRYSGHETAKSTGIGLVGLRGGAIVGPMLFGFIAERSGISAAWQMTAVSMALSASFFIGAQRVWRRYLSALPPD